MVLAPDVTGFRGYAELTGAFGCFMVSKRLRFSWWGVQYLSGQGLHGSRYGGDVVEDFMK